MLGFLRVAAGYFASFSRFPRTRDDKKGGVPSMSYNRDIAIVCRKLDDLGLDLIAAIAQKKPAEEIEAIQWNIRELRQLRDNIYQERDKHRAQRSGQHEAS